MITSLHRFFCIGHLLLVITLLSLSHSLHAQSPDLSSLNPSDIFLDTYFYERDGKALKADGKYDEAHAKFGKALTLLDTIHKLNPTWRSGSVKRAYERITTLQKESVNQKLAGSTERSIGLYSEKPSPSSAVARAKKRAAEKVKNDRNLKELSTKMASLQKKLKEKEKALLQKERAGATKSELTQQLENKDKLLDGLEESLRLEKKATSQKEKLLQDEVDALRAQLARLPQPSKANPALAQKISAKDEEIRLLREAGNKQELQALAQQKALQDQITSLQKTLAGQAELNLTSDQLATELYTKEKALKALQTQYDTLLVEQKHLELAQERSQKNLHATESELATLRAEKTALTTSLRKAQSSFSKEKGTLQERITKLESLQKQTRAYLSENRKEGLDTFTGDTEKLTEEVRLKQEELRKKEGLLATATTSLKQLKTQKTALEQSHQEEVSTLRKQQAERAATLTQLEKELQLTKKNAAAVTAKNKSQQMLLGELSASLEKAQTSQEQALQQLNEEQKGKAALIEELTALQQERKILLTRPLRSEVETLQQDLKDVSQEKESLSKNLSANEEKYYLAIDRISTLQTELKTARDIAAQLEKNSTEEREISNDVIKTQRIRLASQNDALAKVKRQLAVESASLRNLETLLSQSKEEYLDMKQQHDQLQAEHEQLQELLAGGKSEGQLKRENYALRKELLQARTDFEKAIEDDDIEKEDLLMARKKYALLRTELIKAQHELELSTMKGEKLVRRLHEAEADLKVVEESNNAQYSSEEVAMLKNVLKQKMKMQENRQIARSLILEEVKRLGVDDSAFLAALDLSETQELVLSDDQKKLLANPEADGEFRFTDRASPQERKRAEDALNQRLGVHDKLGRSAYNKGRYAAAEEFFRINLDDHPGHIPSMLNLGVAQLRKAQNGGTEAHFQDAIASFEDALAMRGENGLPYALQMLGYAHYQKGDLQKASKFFLQCLDAEPTNAKANIFLGSITAENGDLEASATYLQKALKIDPTLTEPQYNLALLQTEQGNYKEALKNYREAIKKGAAADPELELKLLNAE